MATGTAKGFAVFAGVSSEIIRASAREAEALGYRSFWVNHPGPVDGLGSLAHAAAETRRVDLGVGVIPLHTRGPESIADGVRGHGLAPERLLLGVGSPNPQALKRVRDGVAALRASLSARIIVAALGPKMCHLAGEVADGVLFNWLTPEYARTSSASAASSRRSPSTRAPSTSPSPPSASRSRSTGSPVFSSRCRRDSSRTASAAATRSRSAASSPRSATRSAHSRRAIRPSWRRASWQARAPRSCSPPA